MAEVPTGKMLHLRWSGRALNHTMPNHGCRPFVDTAVDAIITIDGLGNVKDFSRSAERLWGRVNKFSGCGCAGRMTDPDVWAALLSYHITRYSGSAPASARSIP